MRSLGPPRPRRGQRYDFSTRQPAPLIHCTSLTFQMGILLATILTSHISRVPPLPSQIRRDPLRSRSIIRTVMPGLDNLDPQKMSTVCFPTSRIIPWILLHPLGCNSTSSLNHTVFTTGN